MNPTSAPRQTHPNLKSSSFLSQLSEKAVSEADRQSLRAEELEILLEQEKALRVSAEAC